MRKLKLGNSNVEVSALCMGTDSIGSKIDRETSFQLLDAYAERSGSFIDTANFYASWVEGCQGGESETTIGAWMKERGNRDSLAIASKLGFEYPGCDGGLSAAEIERECEKSLRRLQTDRIDLYYAHRDDAATPQEETMEAFDQLVRAGKVRAIGASNLRVWRIAEANTVSRIHGWTQYCTVSQRHTYLRPRHGADFGPQVCVNEDLEDYCRSHGLTVVAYSILLQGAYARDDRPIPSQYAGPEADDRLEALRAVAAEVGVPVNQLIIAWMLQGSPTTVPIIAGSRPEQIIENIAALDVTLSKEQIERLDIAGNPDVKQAWLR